MALDPVLFNTYKQYKAGTASVISWLVNQSKETNVSTKLLPAASGSQGSGRLKGKARAARKENGPKHIVPLASIPQISQAIAEAAKAMVPLKIIRTLEEVIAARSECNDCFEQQGPRDTSTTTSNRKHQYFVEVLRETLQILKPLSRVPDQTKAAKQKASNAKVNNDIIDLQNRLDYLEVDEPTEWTASALPSKTNKTAGTFELEPRDEDVSFAIFCLFKDLTDIRHYVRQTWAEYREHQIAFTTAALTMNTAISIFRRLNEEFIAEFPDFDDHGEIIKYLTNGYCDPNHDKNSQGFATYTGPDFTVSSKIFFCDHTYEHLRLFFMGGELPFFQEKEDQGSGLRFTQDEKTLLKCLSLFGLIASASKGHLYNDQLILGLHLLKTNNPEETIMTWIVFAVQLFVDTRRVVGNELVSCLQEAQQLQQWMSTAVEQSLLCGQTNTVNYFYKYNSGVLHKIKEQLNSALKEDFVQRLMHEVMGDRAALYSWGDFYLFRNHPMLVGLVTQHLLTEIHKSGVSLGGDQGVIMTCIHLNNAFQQRDQKTESSDWVDIEKVIEWQGPSWVFVGDRPKSAGECFRHYNLCMGISATMMSKDRNGKSTARLHKTARNTTLPISKNKNRKLKLMSTYVDLMSAAPRSSGGPEAFYLETNSGTMGRVSTTKNKDASKHPKVHPLSMISLFKECLKSDETILRFDLLAMNQRCVELLRQTQKVCVDQSPFDYPPEEYAGDRHLNVCVSHMMAGVLGLERQQPTRFREACVMVKDVIAGVGDVEYERSVSRCFIKGDGNKKVTDQFSTPVEDIVLFSERVKYSKIILVDGPPGSELTII
ncbi:hypothetical protein LARI1_G004222 [Lachnellula arida]|uniref:DUF6604 domain-containing protein n=1 Tax=Lachnellula arida TaxID=1316785 RepID=A0A8T9BCA4_9HELO|nr:hypothetical protein LARI1_G004222 [Lachnellula arida]